MPRLDWIGKEAVRHHHQEIPYRLLRCDKSLSVGDPGSGNLLVQGDNLEALKALLPHYRGQVKCVVIDPPYNSGNQNWTYNDAVNSPEMRAWLGSVVKGEGEDLCRHDKWLCMMYPRLQLLREFLRPDGAIFVCIADHEVHNLRHLMDEVFGPQNFIATVIWQKIFSPKNSARHLSESHDYLVVYARSADLWRPNLVAREERQNERYKNPDNDSRGPWTSGDCSARNYYSEGTYPITCPSGRVIPGPPKGMYWRFSNETFEKLNREGRIWWGRAGNNVPRVKRFLSEVKQGVVPETIWPHTEVGNTQEAKKELVGICDFEDSASVFVTPKPLRLMKRVLQIASDRDSLILDSFAGSGTTGHAVLDLNREDGGNRRVLLVEMEAEVCRAVTAQRLERVVNGYVERRGDRETTVPGLGGGFRFCTLAEPLFDKGGCLRDAVKFPDLAAHVYFTETGEPIPRRATGKSPLIGTFRERAFYLLFNGVLGDRRPDGGNVLTGPVLRSLPSHDGPRVVYGEGCLLGEQRLRREGITFRQLPYQLRTN